MKKIEEKNIVFTINNYMGSDTLSIAEFNKAIKVLKLRGLDVPLMTELTLKLMERVDSKFMIIGLVYDKEGRSLKMIDKDLAWSISKLEGFGFVQMNIITRKIRKIMPKYELGINTGNPVLPVELKEGDNVITKERGEYHTYIYHEDSGNFWDTIRKATVSEIDTSRITDVLRMKKTRVEEHEDYSFDVMYNKKVSW